MASGRSGLRVSQNALPSSNRSTLSPIRIDTVRAYISTNSDQHLYIDQISVSIQVILNLILFQILYIFAKLNTYADA